jgi:hypothetical protein
MWIGGTVEGYSLLVKHIANEAIVNKSMFGSCGRALDVPSTARSYHAAAHVSLSFCLVDIKYSISFGIVWKHCIRHTPDYHHRQSNPYRETGDMLPGLGVLSTEIAVKKDT